MSELTAGYSFLIEFSEKAINKVVRALFGLTDGGVPTRFADDDPGQPGKLTTRNTQTGRHFYKRYLLEGLVGYELSIYNPFVKLLGGDQQKVEFILDFDLSLLRRLLVLQTDDTLQIPYDPDTVDPDQDYEPVYDSGLHPKNPPSVKGQIGLVLKLAHMPFGAGNRVTIDATTSNLDIVERVDLRNIDWQIPFEDFVETVGAKAITTVLKNEVKEIDVTPLFGVFEAFDVRLRPPIALRIGKGSSNLRSLAVGMHEWSLIDDGDSDKIQFVTEGADYACQIDEGFLSLLVAQMQNSGAIPKRYDTNGHVNGGGPILLYNIRLWLDSGALGLHLLVEYEDFADLFAKTRVKMLVDEEGILRVSLENTSVHIRLRGLIGGIQMMFNTVTFYIIDTLVGKVLGDLLEATVNRSIGGTVDDFLDNGALGFSFNSPIRNTNLIMLISPIDIHFEPGRTTLKGNVEIREDN